MGCDCSSEYEKIREAINGGEGSGEQVKEPRNVVTQTKKTGEYIDETLYGKALNGGPETLGAATGDGTGSAPGKHGAIGSLRFCNWAAPEWGPIGENAWDEAFKAAALAISIANGIAQSEIADRQQDLADSYYRMAEYKWDRFYKKYVPLEKSLLNEVLNEPLHEMDCADDRARASSWVSRAYGAMERWTSSKAKAMRMCMLPQDLARPALRKARALADVSNYNYADDRWYADYRNDKRWNRRSSVLNLGRNLGSEALKYGDVARSLLNSVSGKIEQAASGLVSALGYYGARLDTYYPSSYLGQSQGNLANIGHSIGYGSQQSLGFPGAMGAV